MKRASLVALFTWFGCSGSTTQQQTVTPSQEPCTEATACQQRCDAGDARACQDLESLREKKAASGAGDAHETGGAPAMIARTTIPPPVLMVERNSRTKPLALTDVKINATIVGHLAETEMTMTFYNPNARVMEGDLYFPLPQGSTISGYALDVGGVMVDGVVVDKDRGRQVFETEVRKGVDPGLVEWTTGNNFKTRVFPIPASGSRTIRVSYVAEVTASSGNATYFLPMGFRDKVKHLSLRIEVVKGAAMPVISKGGPKGLSFGAWRDSFVAETKLKDVVLTDDLYVSLPQIGKHPVRVEEAPDGEVYFSIRDHVAPTPRTDAAPAPRRIAIYWDASISRAEASHDQELALLEKYLGSLAAAKVEAYLVVFRNVAEKPRSFQLPKQAGALLQTLRAIQYDGGTQLASAVPGAGMKKVDLSLLFSDGISNFGGEDPAALKAPVYVVNVSSTASHAALRYLAMRTGGAYFNLRETDAERVLKSIGVQVFSFIGAEATGVPPESLYPKLQVPVHDGFDLAGKLIAAEARITLKYGYGGKVSHQETFKVKRSEAIKGDLLQRYWAQKKIDDLIVFPKRNAQEISKVGRHYSIVTPHTSLIVLERLDQYVEHEIRPPAGLKKMRAKYDAQMKERVLVKRKEDASKLAHVLELWEARKAWWNKRYRYPRNYRVGAKKPKKAGAPRRRGDAAELSGSVGGMVAKEKKKSAPPGPDATIVLAAWDPKTPYLDAIKAAPAGKKYEVYLEQRKTHGTAPAFFLDCANYFRAQKRPKLALRILSNLAELELENPALLRVLAHRLAQIGELDHSATMFERALKLRPEEPQSYRDLALVLDRRATRKGSKPAMAREDYQRALALLARVVMDEWARFDEIEVIALTELNNILPRARRLGIKKLPVDKRLIKALDMDVRIVMTWDADSTDMDLHVIEPSGEEAFFGHNRTRIGGLVSRDFTQGYGPEVYAIRRAMRGRYKIRTSFFGSSAAKLQGAVTLQVDIYTNYGRRNQKRKSLTMRLTNEKETFTVGEIGF